MNLPAFVIPGFVGVTAPVLRELRRPERGKSREGQIVGVTAPVLRELRLINDEIYLLSAIMVGVTAPVLRELRLPG